MGPVAIIAGIGLAIGAVGAYESYSAQKKQAKLQRKAIAAQRAQDNMKAARERREAIRNARIASGQIEQAAANQGVSNSSAALGGMGSIEQQLNQGLSFLDGYNTLSDQASRYIGKANKAGVNAGMWGSVSNLGMTVFKNASSIAHPGG
jgi:hypothetical protein